MLAMSLDVVPLSVRQHIIFGEEHRERTSVTRSQSSTLMFVKTSKRLPIRLVAFIKISDR